MSLLDKKLFRDIAMMRMQVATIGLVVAAGVAVLIAAASGYDSLKSGRDRFYAETRFPQVFVSLKRAPLSLVARLREIPGVAAVEPRIVSDVLVDLPSSRLPVSARVVSLPLRGGEVLARLHMTQGSAPEVGAANAAVLNQAFANANGLTPGSSIRLILNGRLQDFRISGIALSSEFVYAAKPGLLFPDDRHFGIIWVSRRTAEAAFDMTGAFNDAMVALTPGTNVEAVVAEIDRLLEPYGSAGAIERRDQTSHRFVEDELTEQRVLSYTLPFIFFGIASFLLNVILGRLVAAQREQIAALKALGFGNRPLIFHYLKLVAVIVMFGAGLGVVMGYVFGELLIASYRDFFAIPGLAFRLSLWSVLVGVAVTFTAASFGALTALRNVTHMTPATAMRPPMPSRFSYNWLDSLFFASTVAPSRLMMLRNLIGRPFRSGLTVLGISLAVPMVILGLFWQDAIDEMVRIQFSLVERGNLQVTFPHPLDAAVITDLAREPGVLRAEGIRTVPVRLRAGPETLLTAVVGLSDDSELRRPRDVALRPIDVANEGITLDRRLAKRLGVKLGDNVSVEVLEGRRLTRSMPVSSLVDEVIGNAAYMQMDELNRLAGEGQVVSGATIFAEPSAMSALLQSFKALPIVASVSVKSYSLASFLDKLMGLVRAIAGLLTIFAVIIAVGVVYNSARVSLQERAWELASLRVLGFRKNEVARVLMGQFMIEVALAIPLGMVISPVLVDLLLNTALVNESFRIPGAIAPRTYVLAAAIVAAAAAASAYGIRLQIDRLDLVAVLKTRE